MFPMAAAKGVEIINQLRTSAKFPNSRFVKKIDARINSKRAKISLVRIHKKLLRLYLENSDFNCTFRTGLGSISRTEILLRILLAIRLDTTPGRATSMNAKFVVIWKFKQIKKITRYANDCVDCAFLQDSILEDCRTCDGPLNKLPTTKIVMSSHI
jgi:hypothetical protein